jgi:hypothetical protein
MNATRYGPRPELGELTSGQKVIVYRSSNDRRRREPDDHTIPAVVVKAARVWVELASTENRLTWRMRRDTQNEDTPYSGNNARFVTPEQHDWEETRRWALGYLQENGIDIRPGSPWRGREVQLADIVSAGTDRTEAL